MTVDLLLIPWLRHTVHDTDSVGDFSLDRCSDIREELCVLGLVVARVPLMSRALSTDFKDEGELITSHLD